jgi:hypothetical protein
MAPSRAIGVTERALAWLAYPASVRHGDTAAARVLLPTTPIELRRSSESPSPESRGIAATEEWRTARSPRTRNSMGDHAAGLGRSGANLEAKPEHRSAAAAAPLRHHLQGERHEHVRDPALGSRAVLPFGGCLRAASGQTDETRAAARTAASRASPSPCGSARRRPPPAGTTRSVAANAHVAVTDHGRCWLQASWTSTLARPAPPQSLQRLLQHPGALLQSALESSRHNTVVHHDDGSPATGSSGPASCPASVRRRRAAPGSRHRGRRSSRSGTDARGGPTGAWPGAVVPGPRNDEDLPAGEED